MPDRSADRHAETPFSLRGLGPLRPRIDAYLKDAGGTVTGFLLRAAKEKLNREDGACRALVEEAFHICMHGEYAPGGTENWGDWCRKAEALLRGEAAPDVAS